MKKYEEIIVEELYKELSLKERTIVRCFRKLIIKVYNISRINTINRFLN